MELDLRISLPINEDEEAQLARILRVDPADLPAAMTPIARAALEEYVRMFVGQKVFTRGADMREYRLFLLVRDLFSQTIPDEERVSALFQTTETQSRSLIRSVLSKYQYEVHEALQTSLTKVVREASRPEGAPEGSDFEASIQNESLVDGLNRTLAERNGALPQVAKKRGTVSTYQIKESSYLVLRDVLGLQDE